MTRLRILMLTRGVVPIRPGCGGAELVAYQLARVLAVQGNDVTLVTDRDAEECPEFTGLRFVDVDSRMHRLASRVPGSFLRWLLLHLVGNLAVVGRARRLLKSGDYDVIHAHGGLSAALLSLMTTTPIVYTEHDAPPWQCRYRRWWERILRTRLYRVLNVCAFRRVSAIAATFEALAEELRGRWGVPAQRVMTIPNGADVETFGQPRTRRPGPSIGASERLPFDRYCLFVGRLEPRKAPDILIDALPEAPGVNCVFAGDGPMRAKLERQAERLGVADRVTFLGAVNAQRLAGLYSAADLLVLPSVSEASPLVVIEAMAAGTPVLATKIAGLPTFVQDWETGFLVRPDDMGQLAVAMRFLTQDHALRRKMSRNARERVGRLFMWPAVARRYQTLYESCLRDPEGAADQPESGVFSAVPAPVPVLSPTTPTN